MGIYKDWLFFETADDYLVSLDARTGKERWHKEIESFTGAVFLGGGPDRHRQSRAGGRRKRSRTRRAPCVRWTRKPVKCSGRFTRRP